MMLVSDPSDLVLGCQILEAVLRIASSVLRLKCGFDAFWRMDVKSLIWIDCERTIGGVYETGCEFVFVVPAVVIV